MSGGRKCCAANLRRNRGAPRPSYLRRPRFDLLIGHPLEISLTSLQGSLAELLRETAFATATPCLEKFLAKPLPEQNPLEETMHTSPFVSSEPVLLEVESSEEYD